MAIALQILCSALIVIAALYFIHKNKKANVKATKGRTALAVFQIILCGWFFSLCVSDFLDIQVNFSLERLIVNIFYIIAFLAIAVYVLFNEFKEDAVYFKGVIWAYLVLMISRLTMRRCSCGRFSSRPLLWRIESGSSAEAS